MNKQILTILLLSSLSFLGFAQQPVVSGVSPGSAPVMETVTISGTNLPTGANAHVQFGAARGMVIEGSSTQIKARVPAGATYQALTVTDLGSNLSAKSNKPFQLSFSGSSFSPTSFTAETEFAGNSGMFDLCSCDFDGDGKVDAITTHEKNTALSSFRNGSSLTGSIQFTKTDIPINAYSRNVVCGDLNGDGKPDLVVSGTGVNGNRIYLLRNTSSSGSISFAPPLGLSLPNKGASIPALHDLNADGLPEVVVTNRTSSIITIFKNTSASGVLQFNSQGQEVSIGGASNTHGISIQDLDSDGKPDIALCPFQGKNIYTLRNTGSGSTISFSAGQTLLTQDGLTNLISADLNGDGKLDLAATNNLTNQLLVWLNTGNNSIKFGSAALFNTGVSPWGVAAGDINGDGSTDLVLSHNNSRSLLVFHNTSTHSKLELIGYHFNTEENGRHASVFDVNGDGKPDLAYTGTTANKLRVFRNTHCVVPRLSHTGSYTLCTGQTLLLQATQALGVTYKWSKNGHTLSVTDSYLTITDAGSYAVTITSAVDGCTLSSEVLQVVASTEGTQSVEMEPIAPVCEGGSAVLKATAISGASYKWNGPNGYTATTNTSTHTLSNAQASAAGSYSVIIKSGECNFTPAAQNLVVYHNPDPSITASATAFCAGTTVTLQAPPGFANYQWKKDGANYTGTGASSSTISTGVAGSYTVVVSNTTGCSKESPALKISQTTAPTAAFTSPDKACEQQPVTFTNTSTYPNAQTPSFLWKFGDGATSTAENPSHIYATKGTYTLSLTVYYGSQQCGTTSSKTIEVVTAPNVELAVEGGKTAICPGEPITIHVIGDNPTSVLWNNGESGTSITVSEEGTHTATVLTSAGCTLTRNVLLTYREQPQISVTASATSIRVGEIVSLTAGGGLDYEWANHPDISTPFSHTVNVSPSKTTTYAVNGWGANGCKNTAEITIEVDNSLRINPPKVLVPAVDGSWIIPDIELYPDVELMIVNSLGRTIYSAKPYTNNWDGSEGGKPLEPGVYYYIFKDAKGKVLKTGSITLLK